MPIPAGTMLGPYEISVPLGAGGMGEVYRARDTRLERDVAVKLLPSEMAADQSRRQRFEHEAKAIAALNHPNIVAIYDTGEHEGLLYLVTELVDGASLRGASFPLRKTLDIAAQITDGLAAAHAAGITHRDLKPDNIMVTRQGRVKILDFGLAKVEGKVPQSEHDATMTAALTDPGTVMGTVGYMSPEQVRAQAIDHRSDIFSFGLILFELLAGKRAFQRASAAETMTAIAKEDAPELPDSVPAGLRLVVMRCLEKGPLHRFDSARDLGFALRTLSQAPASSGQVAALPQTASATKWVAWAAIAIGFLIVGLVAGKLFWPAAEAPAFSGSLLGGPPMAHAPRVSPDGQMLGFLTVVDRQSQVGVMKPDSGNWRILTQDKAIGIASVISWSPDGTRIYYDRDQPMGIYSVPVLGGEARRVLEGAFAPEALPDGSLLVARLNAERRFQVHRFWPETGRLDALPAILGSRDLFGGNFRSFPGGSEALFVGMKRGDPDGRSFLSAVELTSKRVRRLWDQPILYPGGNALSISKDGKQVFIRLPTEGSHRFVSIPSGGGSPSTLLNLQSSSTNSDWGANGNLFLDLSDRPVEVMRFLPAGGRPEFLTSIPFATGFPSFVPLPDGRILMPFPLGDRERLVVATPGAAPQPFVETQEHTSIPSTLVGNREVAFMIGPPERPSIAIASVSDGRILQRLAALDGPVLSLAASPDGKTLYYTLQGTVWEIPRSGGQQPRKLRAGDFVSAHPSGGELLVQVNQQDRNRLIRFRLDGGPEREIPLQGNLQLTTVPLAPTAIARDGRILAVVSSPDSWFWQAGIIHPETGVITRVPVQIDGDMHYAGWTADGRIIAATKAFDSHIWRMRPIHP